MISRILLVEGSKMIASAISPVLSEEFGVIKAFSLKEALDIIKTTEIDALVTARTLPDGTGFELAAEVKKKKDIPVIMLIADEDVPVSELHPYVDRYVSKVGLKPEQLKKELEEIEKEIENLKQREDKVILVVDDSAMLRRALVNALSKKYKTEEAENGKVAFEKAVKVLPNLITMDVDMPVMDGITASSLIKAHIRTRHIPILLLTSHKDPETVKKGFEAGVNMYLPKDTPVDELVKIVDKMLEVKPKQKKILFITTEDYAMDAVVSTPLKTEGYILNIATSEDDIKGILPSYDVIILNEDIASDSLVAELEKVREKVLILTEDEEQWKNFKTILKPFEAEDLLKILTEMLKD